LPCEHSQITTLPAQKFLLNCEQENAQEEFVVLNWKTELNMFNLEENKIIICQKLASSMLTATKYLKVSKRLTATQDSFFTEEHGHRVLKILHSRFYWALKLGWFYSFMYHCQSVLVMHHFLA